MGRSSSMSHVECARRRREIAQALRGSEPRKAIAARFSVSYDLIWRVARDYGLPMATSGRRPASWPDIPDHLRKDYRRLCQYMAPEAARAKLEGSAHVG